MKHWIVFSYFHQYPCTLRKELNLFISPLPLLIIIFIIFLLISPISSRSPLHRHRCVSLDHPVISYLPMWDESVSPFNFRVSISTRFFDKIISFSKLALKSLMLFAIYLKCVIAFLWWCNLITGIFCF
jgi:hypothetical protein